MALRLGDTGPDFTADSTQGRIGFHEWLGGFVGDPLLASPRLHPICTPGLGYMARLKPESISGA